jgi:hypothetical protein
VGEGQDHYPSKVRGYWQANAWADTAVMNQITDDFLTDVADIEGGAISVLTTTVTSRTNWLLLTCSPVFTPPQCTDPVDHHVNG